MDILKRPIITEKFTTLGETLNKYGFVVDGKANKVQIKNAVEELYEVNVRDVRTMNMPAKNTSRFTKSGISRGRKSGYKKAIITVAEGESIDFYSKI